MKHPARFLFTALRLALGGGLLYYVLQSSNGWAIIGRLFSHPWILLGLAGLPILGVAFEAIRLRILFLSQEIKIEFGRAYRIVAIGSFFNLVIPGGTGGDVTKLYYLGSANRGKGIEVATVLLVDRVVAFSSLLIAIVALALLERNLMREHGLIAWLVAGSAAMVVAITLSLFLARPLSNSRAFRSIFSRLPMQTYAQRFQAALLEFRNQTGALIVSILLSLLGHLALIGLFMTAGAVLVPDGSALVVALLSLLGMLANVLPITPGGLGVGEAAADQLFALAGLSGGATLILAWRMATFPICVFGCISYIADWR